MKQKEFILMLTLLSLANVPPNFSGGGHGEEGGITDDELQKFIDDGSLGERADEIVNKNIQAENEELTRHTKREPPASAYSNTQVRERSNTVVVDSQPATSQERQIIPKTNLERIANAKVQIDALHERLANAKVQIDALHERLIKKLSVEISPKDRQAIDDVTNQWNLAIEMYQEERAGLLKANPNLFESESNRDLASAYESNIVRTDEKVQALKDLITIPEPRITVRSDTAPRITVQSDTTPGLITRLKNWLQQLRKSFFEQKEPILSRFKTQEKSIITELNTIYKTSVENKNPTTKEDQKTIARLLTTLSQNIIKKQPGIYNDPIRGPSLINVKDQVIDQINSLYAGQPFLTALIDLTNKIMNNLTSQFTIVFDTTKRTQERDNAFKQIKILLNIS